MAEARASSELGARIGSALVLGILALVSAYRGGWLLTLFWVAAAMAIAWEASVMAAIAPPRRMRTILLGGLAALGLLAHLGWPGPATVIVLLGICAVLVVAGAGTRDRLWGLAAFLTAAVIAVVPLLVWAHPALGVAGLFWMFAVVWTTDVTAYFTGRALGGPKLWPRVSPKKTWSGFVGGLAAAVAAGLAVTVLARDYGTPLPVGLAGAALLSGLASIASQLGDLGESALKRWFGVKDSGRIIPGHGGVMDRLDGFWAVAVLAGLALAGARLLHVQ